MSTPLQGNDTDSDSNTELFESSPATITTSTESKKQHELWNETKAFINTWFYKMDTNILLLSASQYCGHFQLNEVPCWCFILGPSSSGKTRIGIQPLIGLPHVHTVGTMTENSLLSGWKDGGMLRAFAKYQASVRDAEGKIISSEHRQQGILVYPDFSTFLHLNEMVRANIQAQMRTLYDGYVQKAVGNSNKMITWKGKATQIAACTPELERHWSVTRELGERWLTYRMKDRDTLADSLATAKMAGSQVGNEDYINKTIAEKIKRLIDPESMIKFDTGSGDEIPTQLIYLSHTVANLRRTVTRNQQGYKREITYIATKESVSRLVKSLMQIAVGNAILFRHPEVTTNDYSLAVMIGAMSIPAWRYKVIMGIWQHIKAGNSSIKWSELQKSTNIPIASYTQVLEDLEAVDMIEVYKDGVSKQIELTDSAIEMLEHANMPTNLYPVNYVRPRKGDIVTTESTRKRSVVMDFTNLTSLD